MKKNRLVSVLALLSVICSLPGRVYAAGAEWKLGNWTQSDENGEQVITAPDKNQFSNIELSRLDGANCCEFDIRILSSTAVVDGNIGFSYYVGNYEYFFEYNLLNEYAVIRELDGAGIDNRLSESVSYKIPLNEWKHFKVIAATDYLRLYINGELICEGNKTMKELKNGKFSIQGYFCQPQIKNIATSIVEIPKNYIDLAFSSSAAAEQFTCEGGQLSWKDGSGLIYNLSGGGALVSPNLEFPAGDPYCAVFPLRSTICVFMKNGTSCDKVKVSFITDKDMTYDDTKQKEFSIKANSDYTMYYFNFADNCSASGALRGFRIEWADGSGEIAIKNISFEREDKPYTYSGQLTSCRAENDTITITGTLSEAYAGKAVTLYETTLQNYNSSVGAMKRLESVTADGTSFTVTIPFMDGNMSRLSSMFMLTCGTTFVCPRFTVENYRDFSDNPYKFEIPQRSIKVTDEPYSAKGDGYTDDTAAIQKALDDMSAAGGGKVIIPGDPDNPYGIRYIITNVKMRDNTELYISEGAVLWQSPRAEDYAYEVAYGHNVSLAGINWTHAGLCHNLPLVQGYEVNNVRVTGGGTVRSDDCGSQCADGVDGSTIWTGCAERIHVIPIAMYGCNNVEVSDLTLLRTNCYHLPLYACTNVYIANMQMYEATCASGDGISAEIGTNHMKIDRCFLFSNDDGVVLDATYDEPRGLTWWHARPEADNCIYDIEVCHSYIVSGHGLTFVPWCTDNPDQSRGEIKSIVAYDNVFGGGSCAVGGWYDNPYFGGVFDDSDKNDFSPIKDVWLYSNRYLNGTSLGCTTPTNIITDCGIHSSEQFVNGDFENAKKTKWTAGLSYWSQLPNTDDSSIAFLTEDKNHSGVLQKLSSGSAKLYQGLYTQKANVTFSIDVKAEDSKAKLFIISAGNGKVIAELDVPSGSDGTFRLTAALEAGTYCFGVEGVSGNGRVIIDNAELTRGEFDSALFESQTSQKVDSAFVLTEVLFKSQSEPGTDTEPVSTNEESNIISDTSAEGSAADTQDTGTKKPSVIPYIAIGGIVAAALVILTAVFIKKKKGK